MTTTKSPDNGRKEGLHGMNTPPIVSAQEWGSTRKLLVKKRHPARP